MHVAVVPYREASPERTLPAAEQRDLLHVTAALQMQVVRDLAPLWGISATVSPFMRLIDVPTGYWPLVLVEQLPSQRFPRGVHFASGSRPFAIVLRTAEDWSRAASHELMEMLCDPWGNFTAPGRSLTQELAVNQLADNPYQVSGPPGAAERQVEYLVEVCDPCQKCSYTINGVLVSDFVTPQYYDPFQTRGARYSYTGEVTRPRQVLPEGYLTWRQPEDGEVWQAFASSDGAKLTITQLGGSALPADVSLREWVDDLPGHHDIPKVEDKVLTDGQGAYQRAGTSAKSYGERVHRDIGRLYREARVERSGALRLSGDFEKIRQLYKDLSTEGPERKAFEKDPVGELAKRGIVARGVMRAQPKLPTPKQFEEMWKLSNPRRQGPGPADELPLGQYWWLGVYGVYGR